jgi:DNA-binding response OmpR family regulator
MGIKKILLIEDDVNLGIITRDFLKKEGFHVEHCADGESGKKSFQNNRFHLILIDVMLPLLDGFSLARFIRKENSKIPIIFLTAKSMEEDRIKGFNLGADDYIIKPFSPGELVLRINAILRRAEEHFEWDEDQHVFHFGKFTFDHRELLLKTERSSVRLTKKEAGLLRMLCQNQGRLLKREIILKEIWGENDYFLGRSMDVYIFKLRKLLKEDPSISIVNVHNAGFKLDVDPDKASQY